MEYLKFILNIVLGVLGIYGTSLLLMGAVAIGSALNNHTSPAMNEGWGKIAGGLLIILATGGSAFYINSIIDTAFNINLIIISISAL